MDEAPKSTTPPARPSSRWPASLRSHARPPRFSVTPGAIQGPPPKIGADNDQALADWGFSAEAIAGLKQSGAL
ncbi:hypothetical protein ACRAWD_16360 [Caulobacter segnis]